MAGTSWRVGVPPMYPTLNRGSYPVSPASTQHNLATSTRSRLLARMAANVGFRVADEPRVPLKTAAKSRLLMRTAATVVAGQKSQLGRNLPHHTIASAAPGCGAEKGSVGIDGHASLRVRAVAAAGEVMQIRVDPAAT